MQLQPLTEEMDSIPLNSGLVSNNLITATSSCSYGFLFSQYLLNESVALLAYLSLRHRLTRMNHRCCHTLSANFPCQSLKHFTTPKHLHFQLRGFCAVLKETCANLRRMLVPRRTCLSAFVQSQEADSLMNIVLPLSLCSWRGPLQMPSYLLVCKGIPLPDLLLFLTGIG